MVTKTGTKQKRRSSYRVVMDKFQKRLDANNKPLDKLEKEYGELYHKRAALYRGDPERYQINEKLEKIDIKMNVIKAKNLEISREMEHFIEAAHNY